MYMENADVTQQCKFNQRHFIFDFLTNYREQQNSNTQYHYISLEGGEVKSVILL